MYSERNPIMQTWTWTFSVSVSLKCMWTHQIRLLQLSDKSQYFQSRNFSSESVIPQIWITRSAFYKFNFQFNSFLFFFCFCIFLCGENPFPIFYGSSMKVINSLGYLMHFMTLFCCIVLKREMKISTSTGLPSSITAHLTCRVIWTQNESRFYPLRAQIQSRC